MSDNTRDIAFEIFSKQVLAKNSIQLELEESCVDLKENVEDFVFDVLTMITFHGIEILYGHKNIAMLTKDQFKLVQEYTNSYGYNITHRIKDNNLLIGFEKIN
jgi:hypothetical protein